MSSPEPIATATWQSLTLSNPPSRKDSRVPPLYYRYTSDSASSSTRLALHLTDLTILYSCRLSTSEIVDEARRSDSPIDPENDSKQLDVLLNYLTKSLQGDDNVLARDSISTDEGNGTQLQTLKLRTTTDLPSPLPKLSFTFTLGLQPAAELSNVLTLPMLRALKKMQAEAERLLDVIVKKDHVIQKLLDRVGSQVQGDMSSVFPVLNGKGKRDRGVTVKEAERWVEGLKAFEGGDGDCGVLREGMDGLVSGVNAVESWAESASRRGGEGAWVMDLSEEESRQGLRSDQGADKARLLRTESTQARRDGRRPSRSNRNSADAETESDDEFERQPTPPSARKAKSPSNVEAAAAPRRNGRDDSTTDDNEDEPPPTKKRKTSLQPSGSRPGARLGGLKRSKQTSHKPGSSSNNSSPSPAGGRRVSTASTATASGTESDKEDASPARTRAEKKGKDKAASPASGSESDLPQAKSIAGKGKVSRLGGLRKKQHNEDQPDYSDTNGSATASSSDNPGARRVGQKHHPSSPSRSATKINSATPSRGRLGRLHRSTTRSPSPEESAKSTPSHQKPGKKLGALRSRRKQSTEPDEPAENHHNTHQSRMDEAIAEETESEEDLDLDGGGATNTSRQQSQRTANMSRAAAQHAAADKDREEAAGERATAQKEEQQAKETKGQEAKEEEETPEQAAQRRREELKRRTAAIPARVGGGAGGGKRRRL